MRLWYHCKVPHYNAHTYTVFFVICPSEQNSAYGCLCLVSTSQVQKRQTVSCPLLAFLFRNVNPNDLTPQLKSLVRQFLLPSFPSCPSCLQTPQLGQSFWPLDEASPGCILLHIHRPPMLLGRSKHSPMLRQWRWEECNETTSVLWSSLWDPKTNQSSKNQNAFRKSQNLQQKGLSKFFVSQLRKPNKSPRVFRSSHSNLLMLICLMIFDICCSAAIAC